MDKLNIKQEIIAQCYANGPVLHKEKYVWNAKVTVTEMCSVSIVQFQENVFQEFTLIICNYLSPTRSVCEDTLVVPCVS